MTCPTCGLQYRELKTGLSYRQVFEQFWVSDTDNTKWKNKRRRTILGRWHEIKKRLWENHLEVCALQETFDNLPF